jgi:hypothetical protein
MSRFDFAWPDEAIEKLKKLRSEGITNLQIARDLSSIYNYPISRNAVIGKSRRLGLLSKNPPKNPAKRQPVNLKPLQSVAPKKEPIIERGIIPVPAHSGPSVRTDPVAVSAMPVLSPVGNVRFLESLGGCKAIIGTTARGDALVCAKPLWRRGSSWCAECRAVYTVPVRARA